jgi:prepilin-type N-terminal cleavage/methylation domain-containing protein/prepilin-type processing-associated H-X9-DG protein
MHAYNLARRRGFTLIELLVVLAIIAVLIALLVPAAQRVREAANRTSCRNNLRQIAIAVHHYHDQNGFLPPDSLVGRNWGTATQGQNWGYANWSWLARILPYIEKGDLYREANIPTNTLEASQAWCAAAVKTYLCPSDNTISGAPRTDQWNLAPRPIGQTNYKGVIGSTWIYSNEARWNNQPPGTPDGLEYGNGLFYRNAFQKKRRFADAIDGLSNTFLIGEDVPEKNRHCSWPYANGSTGTCSIGPNSKRLDGSEYSPDDWPNVYSFRSRHPGGLQFALADGSVHFISDGIALTLYRALASADGGEAVSVP